MQFSQTLCFLVALSLTVLIGVPDSFAQKTFALSITPNNFTETDADQEVTVTVNAVLSAAAPAGGVTITLIPSLDWRVPTPYFVFTPTGPLTIAAGATRGSQTGTLVIKGDNVYRPPRVKISSLEESTISDPSFKLHSWVQWHAYFSWTEDDTPAATTTGTIPPIDQAKRFALTVSPNSFVEKDADYTVTAIVTATLSEPAPAGGVTVTLDEGKNRTAIRRVVFFNLVGSPTITIDAGATISSTTARFHIEGDNVFQDTSVKTGDMGGSTATGSFSIHSTNKGVFTVREDESPTGGTITIVDVTPPSFNQYGGGAQSVVATVKLSKAPGSQLRLFCNLYFADNSLASTDDILFQANQTQGTKEISISRISSSRPEQTLELVISGDNYVPAVWSIPLISRDATDAQGYRVVLDHENGEWVGVGANKVKVHVIRADETAYPWTEFKSIKVAIRDTIKFGTGGSAAELPIQTLNTWRFGRSGGTLAFGKDHADSGSVKYNQNEDRLEFMLTTTNNPDTTTAATGTMGDIPSTHARAREDAAKHRTAVRAVVTFIGTSNWIFTIDSKDTQSNISATSTVKVGDGKLIKLDLLRPDLTQVARFFSGIRVNLIRGGRSTAVSATTEARRGDELEVVVTRTDVRPRTDVAQVRIRSRAGTGITSDEINRARATTLGSQNFSVSELARAAGDSVRYRVRVENLNFQNVKATNASTKDRNGKTLKNNAQYEPDYLLMRGEVVLKDLAGNVGVGGTMLQSPDFRADRRPPVVTILQPKENARFTGAYRDTLFGFRSALKRHFKPLKLRVDEGLDSLFAYVQGAEQYKLNLMDNNRKNPDVGNFVHDFGDTTEYNTRGLKHGNNKATAQGGTAVNLVIKAIDKVGNMSTKMISVTHDEKEPKITDFFPRNSLLDENKINNATRHPVITLPETIDSLSVIYRPSSGKTLTQKRENVSKGEIEVMFPDTFRQNVSYSLKIFARDLAGNVFETDERLAQNMRFDNQFKNPTANKFTVMNHTDFKSDSTIAGRAHRLVVQAVDGSTTPNRNAVTYKNADADGNMALDVRAVAEDAQGMMVSYLRFAGTGVTDNGDGSATLNANGWKVGKREIAVMSDMAVNDFTVKVQHRVAGSGGTASVSFEGMKDSLYVDAADFQKLTLMAYEEGETTATTSVWGDFNLKVVPTDKYGNPSLKTYLTDAKTKADSLSILDTRLGGKSSNKYSSIDIRLQGTPSPEELPTEIWGVGLDGYQYSLTAPNKRGKSLQIQARVLASSLKDGDDRSENVRGSLSLMIQPSLMPMLAAFEGTNAVTGDVVIPPGGSATVTVKATGFLPNSMLTFTKNGTAMDAVSANASGEASLSVTMNAAGMVTVSAASGQDTASPITINFVKQARKTYVDANNNPVYLVYTGDSPPDMTVDNNDFQAFAAAFPSSEGDANYNLQADIDGDGDVDMADFTAFSGSWGRTAVEGEKN